MAAERPASSRPIARITCPACGMEQPVSMDCVGCRREFALAELNAARQAVPPAATSPAAPQIPAEQHTPASPSRPANPTPVVPVPPPVFRDEVPKEPVFRDEVPIQDEPSTAATHSGPAASDAADQAEADADAYDPDVHGDVYDPATAIHTPRPSADYVGGAMDLSAGELVQEAIQGTIVNFLPVAVVTIVVSIPAWLYALYFQGTMEAVAAQEIGWGTVVFRFVCMLTIGFFSQLMGAAALTHVIRCWLGDKTVVLSESLGVAFRCLGVLVLLTMVQSIGIGIGYMLLIIPGLILTAGWAVAVPAAVVERLGVVESLTRSWSLTEGSRLNIFVAFLILGVLNWVLAVLSGFLLSEGVSAVLDPTLGTIFTAVESVLTALIYFKLRSADEGVPIDHIG